MNDANTASQNSTATVNITGGNVTLSQGSGIIFNSNSSIGGGSTLNVSGGSLFLGNGGANNQAFYNAGGSGSTVNVNFSGGTVGAVASWSTLTPINLGGNVTFQTGNVGAANSTTTVIAAGAAGASNYGITLNGLLSGTGGFTESGGSGTLALTANNTYTGATTVNSGILSLSATGAIVSPTVTINSTGTLSLNSTANLGSGVNLLLMNGSAFSLALGDGNADTINTLSLNGTAVAPGTYSIADLQNQNTQDGTSVTFSGNGSLIITVPEPRSLSLLAVAAAGLGAAGYSRCHRKLAA